jgi:phosphoenolpyruvate carboxylase
MRAGMSYFHETIWKGVPKFLRRVDTALKNLGINERLPYNAPLIQFSSWMGGDRDGKILFHGRTSSEGSLLIEEKKKKPTLNVISIMKDFYC